MEHADSTKSTAREYCEALLIAIIFVNFARIFAFQAFKIPTGSMIDNLLVGDHIVVNKFIYGSGRGLLQQCCGFREVRRGDVVVFRYPRDPNVDYVKRVIALPGEIIEIKNKRVSVNGRMLEEPYVVHDDPNTYEYAPDLDQQYQLRDQLGPITVSDGHYFVMGDNRDLSNDSRYWGTVPRSLIKGKALLVYWSFDGKPPLPGSPPMARVRELVAVTVNFFSRTRWERTFFVIDSEYHFGARRRKPPQEGSRREVENP